MPPELSDYPTGGTPSWLFGLITSTGRTIESKPPSHVPRKAMPEKLTSFGQNYRGQIWNYSFWMSLLSLTDSGEEDHGFWLCASPRCSLQGSWTCLSAGDARCFRSGRCSTKAHFLHDKLQLRKEFNNFAIFGVKYWVHEALVLVISSRNLFKNMLKKMDLFRWISWKELFPRINSCALFWGLQKIPAILRWSLEIATGLWVIKAWSSCIALSVCILSTNCLTFMCRHRVLMLRVHPRFAPRVITWFLDM